MTATTADQLFLRAATELAEQGRMTCAPNPPVGCVIVRGGQIIGRGFHAQAGHGHAEVNARDDAGGDISEATVYVSLEPCAFEGRTPACANMLIEAQVARVVIAANDPHPQVAGAGVSLMRAAGIEVELLPDPLADELITGYVSRIMRQRPFVRIKTGSSLDGATALASGQSQWITSLAARADVQYWRARADAIITGVGTVLADDPQLNVRDPRYDQCKQPLRVILDTDLQTPPAAKVLTDGGPTLVVHGRDATDAHQLSRAPNVSTLALDQGPADLASVLSYLAQQGCNEVLVEAGARVCGSFAEQSLWDEWLCYVAPKWLGSQTRPLAEFKVMDLAQAPVGLVKSIERVGDDCRIRVQREAL